MSRTSSSSMLKQRQENRRVIICSSWSPDSWISHWGRDGSETHEGRHREPILKTASVCSLVMGLSPTSADKLQLYWLKRTWIWTSWWKSSVRSSVVRAQTPFRKHIEEQLKQTSWDILQIRVTLWFFTFNSWTFHCFCSSLCVQSHGTVTAYQACHILLFSDYSETTPVGQWYRTCCRAVFMIRFYTIWKLCHTQHVYEWTEESDAGI